MPSCNISRDRRRLPNLTSSPPWMPHSFSLSPFLGNALLTLQWSLPLEAPSPFFKLKLSHCNQALPIIGDRKSRECFAFLITFGSSQSEPHCVNKSRHSMSAPSFLSCLNNHGSLDTPSPPSLILTATCIFFPPPACSMKNHRLCEATSP